MLKRKQRHYPKIFVCTFPAAENVSCETRVCQRVRCFTWNIDRPEKVSRETVSPCFAPMFHMKQKCHPFGWHLSLSIKSVFTPKQQSRGSAHSKAFAAQTHEPVGLYPQKYLMRATGGVYLGFHTLRGRKFPYGNFRTSVFCEVKTQIVGKTKFFDSLRLPETGSLFCVFSEK